MVSLAQCGAKLTATTKGREACHGSTLFPIMKLYSGGPRLAMQDL
jgi:hypothetical protein